MRSSWIKPRLGKDNVTQMNFARNGYITEEMDFVAKKENLPSSLICLLYTSPSPRDISGSRMPSSA